MLEIEDLLERQHATSQENILATQVYHTSIVSPLHDTRSRHANKLCIHDLKIKLMKINKYDIGGTIEPRIWFYYTTSVCPGKNYLMNLFAHVREPACYTIGISDSTKIKCPGNESDHCHLPDTLESKVFRTAQPEENIYIKTLNFTEEDLKTLGVKSLFIPISIDIVPITTTVLDKNITDRIKINHDLNELLKKQEKTDFVLESVSRKKYPTHKIILAAHSAVLRNIVEKHTDNATEFIDISDEDMELLLQFLYTGTIKDLFNQDYMLLLNIAKKFQLENLSLLTQYLIKERIETNNAVELAVLCENYQLTYLQTVVFEFIDKHKDVLLTDGWKSLKDVNLAKKLFQYLHENSA